MSENVTAVNSLVNISGNSVFWLIVSLAIAVLIVSLIAAIYTNYKRGTSTEMWEVLKSMFTHPLFWGFMAGEFIAGVFFNQYEAMFAAALVYLGIKLAFTEVIVTKQGDNKFAWFESSKLNTWMSFIISTKTVVVLLASVVLWLAGYNGLFDSSIVGERVAELAGAWLAAAGIPLGTLLKNKDMSFLNPVPKPKQPVSLPVAQSEGYGPPAQGSIAQDIPDGTQDSTVNQEAPNYPKKPFNEEDFDADLIKKTVESFGVNTLWLNLLAVNKVADDRAGGNTKYIARYASEVVAFGARYWGIAESAFVDKFGFKYADRNEPESLKMLRDKCGKTPVSFFTFIATTSDDPSYKQVYDECNKIYTQFMGAVQYLHENADVVNPRLQAFGTGYTYWNAFWNARSLMYVSG